MIYGGHFDPEVKKDRIKENTQNEIKQNLRNSFSKAANKSLQNQYYFSKDKGAGKGM